ncbi:hypothetical protein Poly59_08810 [Rubripirellula reticaptiva]|uniref:Uncharacterized protein n=2 Tax=Rubripirellula reticaptiva TaxID=2528013 RepID=A0A5C6FB19_9BACT|nr:hypothetical protein Poly59_08810 [Rubripirellula reticaptiva]
MTVIFLACVGEVTVASAEDGILKSKPGFGALVVEAMAARASVVAGEFEYRIDSIKGRGDDIEWTQEGVYGFDERSDRSIHAFKRVRTEHAVDQNPSNANVGGGIISQTENGLQVTGGGVFSPDVSFLFPPESRVGFAKLLETRRNYPYLTPFNFRSFGFAFYGDLLKNSPFDKVIAYYLAVDDSTVPEVQASDLPTELLPAISDARYFDYGNVF